MTDTPASNSSAPGADFDMIAALDWKDGIATLPGSNIRVQTLSNTDRDALNPLFLILCTSMSEM